ncbi:MAG: Gfo/Idh/MocA family oxidoreductase [Chloroflexi bacterium]|nr:Gfo/Idh/MocA family oxidoreductase [Chloroflexota bacterium]
MHAAHIRIGIVGAGANTRSKHIPHLQAIPDVEIVGVCNRSRASSARVAQEFGIPTVYENWQALVTSPDIDAIVIGTWPDMHCPVALAALAADKHVLCEARMAMHGAEARAMRDAARARPHLVAQVVPSPFTFRADTIVRELIAANYLGDILAVEVRDTRGFIDRQAPLRWRHDLSFSGVNIMTLGIWYEGLMRWIGPATRVMALGKTFVKMRPDEHGILRAIQIPDHLDISADMACGAQAHFQLSQVTGLSGPSGITLYGSNGTLQFADNQLFGGQTGDSALREIPIPPAKEVRWRVEEEFINAIRGLEEVTLTTFEDGVKYMEFTEAVTRSIASGQSIALPLL